MAVNSRETGDARSRPTEEFGGTNTHQKARRGFALPTGSPAGTHQPDAAESRVDFGRLNHDAGRVRHLARYSSELYSKSVANPQRPLKSQVSGSSLTLNVAAIISRPG